MQKYQASNFTLRFHYFLATIWYCFSILSILFALLYVWEDITYLQDGTATEAKITDIFFAKGIVSKERYKTKEYANLKRHIEYEFFIKAEPYHNKKPVEYNNSDSIAVGDNMQIQYIIGNPNRNRIPSYGTYLFILGAFLVILLARAYRNIIKLKLAQRQCLESDIKKIQAKND